MADALFNGDGDNAEYDIHRRPDLQVITPGARIQYSCDWRGAGGRPQVIGPDHSGPRDGIRWYSYGSVRPDGWFQSQIKTGPLQDCWDLTWDDRPGQYVVIAEIRDGSAPQHPPTYRYRSQQLGAAGAMLGDWLDKLLKHGDGPSPEEAEREIGRYRKLLDDIARKSPPRDAAAHQQVVENWGQLAAHLRGLLAPSDGKRRIPVRGLHLETQTQVQRPLLLFLTELDDVTRPIGNGRMVTMKRWALVDWTDASHPRFRGHHEGEGHTAQAAIEACFSAWDWGNAYPEGHVQFEVPRSVRSMVGGDVRRQMRTNGTTLTEEVVIVFQWIAIGTMMVAGFCCIFVAVPTVASLTMGTSVLASTAGAVFSVAQRWRQGLFDWRADALDGLTIVGNLMGASVWARGARVRAWAAGGKKLDFVFLGARVGVDAVQGILIVESRIAELEALMKDPSVSPEERARRALALIAELAAVGLMTAVSLKASVKEGEVLSDQPKHLPGDPRVNVPDETLTNLTRRDGPVIDTTVPPVAEGHTARTPQQRTRVQTGVTPVPVRLDPHETDFAKAYPPDMHPWRRYRILRDEIELVDKDGFRFHAECNDGTLNITIYTVFDPKQNPRDAEYFGTKNALKSTVMRAKDLYPRMYKHFEQAGNPVTRLEGSWAWTNYNDAKVKFDELIATGMEPRAAARVAVTYARSYIKYHKPMGFTRVVTAEHHEWHQFSFTIERE